jgi:cell division protein FtsZ
MIFGAVVDPNMGEEMRITVIATGFDRAGMTPRRIERPNSVGARQTSASRPASLPAQQPAQRPVQQQHEEAPASSAPLSDFSPRSYNTDDLDIPAFLRRR